LNVKTVASTAGAGLVNSKPVVVEVPQSHAQQSSNEQLSSRLHVAQPTHQAEPEWFYTDPQQQVQGPFSQENMKLWHEAGYFSKDLPIKLRQWSGFHAFYLVFPDLSRAFTSIPSEVRPNFPSMPALSSVHSLEHIHALEQQRLQEQLRQQEQQRQQQFLREQQLFEQRQAEESHRQQQQIEQQIQQQRLAEQQAAVDAAAARRSKEIRVDVSGPPPLTPVTLDNKLLVQQSTRNVVVPSASTPPPLDSLRKIRISTNIGELNQKAAPVIAAVGEVPKKSAASSGPPPLAQDRSREVVPSSSVPWAASGQGGKGSGTSKDSLLAIQNVEKEKALAVKSREAELRQSTSSKNWTSGAPPKAQMSASLAEIQEEESRQREKERALIESRQPVAAPLTMSSQLKSLLGVRPAGNGIANATSPLVTKQWAASSNPVMDAVQSSGAVSLSLRDIMQQEEKQTGGPVNGPVSSGTGGRKQPLSWAAKASTGVNASNLMPVPSATAGQSQLSSQSSVQVSTKAPPKPVSVAATTTIKQRDISVGADFGGKGMSREMAEWCTAQLRKITSSVADLSALMEFCTSLDSASEIREYLSQYLGSSPQVL
jgi:hypothetical protein